MLRKLTITGLTKQTGYRTIIADICLTIHAGELIVITGPNGAGKTTFLQILAGMTRASAGEIFWDQERFTPHRDDRMRKIGLLGHCPMIYESLTAFENLRFFAEMYNVYDPLGAEALLQRVGLEEDQHERVVHFSRGMRQRLALARMLVHDPELLLYDEPFTGLDSAGQELLSDLIREMQDAGKLQLLTTHHPEELRQIPRLVVRLEGGRVVSGEAGGR